MKPKRHYVTPGPAQPPVTPNRFPSPAKRAEHARLRRRRVRGWTILAVVAMFAIPPIPRGLVWAFERTHPLVFVGAIALLVCVGGSQQRRRRR